MALSAPLLVSPAVDAVRCDVAEMARGLELVGRSLVAAAERCAAMEARLDERQRRLDERWRRMEQQAQAIEENLAERWCSETDCRVSPEVRLTALEQSIAQTVNRVFPRIEELLSRVNKDPVYHPAPSPRQSIACSTSSPSQSNPSTSSQKSLLAPLPLLSPASTSAAASSENTQNSLTSIYLGSDLRSAANFGNRAKLQVLIQRGVDVNSANRNGRTAMHCAAFRGSRQCISELVQHGACVNSPDKTKVTPLHCAVMNGHKDATCALLEAGASVSAQDSSGKTALDIAPTKAIRDVLQAASGGTTHSVTSTSQNTTPTVPSGGATSASLPTSPLDELLRSAAINGHHSKVLSLLQQGANPNSRNSNGRTPLHLAAMKGYAMCVKCLLDHSADPNIKDNANVTPQYYARQGGFYATVKEILQYTDEEGSTCSDSVDSVNGEDEYYFYD